MKHVDTWLNEKDFKSYKRKANKMGATPYSLTKNLILKYLEEEREKTLSLNVAYYFICYSLIVATILFVFIF